MNWIPGFLRPRLFLPIVGAGRTGAVDNTAFSTTGVREGKTGEQIIGQAHGKYYEAAMRGNLYSCVTVAAGRALGTALGLTPPITVYNPLGSNKFLAIKRVGFSSINVSTGVFGTGTLFHCVYTLNGPVATQGGTVPALGTAGTILNCLIGAPQASIATVIELPTLHTTNPVIVMPFANISEVASGTIAGNSNTVFDDVDGAIVLGPGSGWCLEGITAAIANVQTGAFSVCWEEIPLT